MERKGFITLGFVFVLLLTGPAFSFPIWQKVSNGVLESNIQRVYSDSNVDGLIYFVSTQSLYSIKQPYQAAAQLASLPSGVHQVFQLKISQNNSDQLFVLTDSGVFIFSNSQLSWQKIYDESKENSQSVYDLVELDGFIYLATDSGLVVGSSRNTVWRSALELDHQAVYRLVESNKFLYAATDQGVYQMKRKSKQWRKIFNIGTYSAEEIQPEDEELVNRFIKDVVVLNSDPDVLIVSTAQGIFENKDGHHFKSINSMSLPNDKVLGLLKLNNLEDDKAAFLASTSDGVYYFDGKIWAKLFQGIDTNEINHLAIDQNYLWAATARGIFYLSKNELEVRSVGKQVNRALGDSGEPTIGQVHRWAIDYAEVSSDKIKNWRRAVRQKALLPDLSVGLTRDAGEIFHWDTGPSPDVLQKGRDLTDWDISLTWNLGELIWNNDQTSIDSRSKLMVELRQDILDQLTRLYFERRRLMLLLSNSDEDGEEITLRVQELTALIDGYTGSLFSKTIEMIKSGSGLVARDSGQGSH